MKIEKMNITILKKVLQEKGLPSGGTKNDLEMRLRQHLQDTGEDPETFDYVEESSGESNEGVSDMFVQLKALIQAQSEKLQAQSELIDTKLQAQSEVFNNTSKEIKDRLTYLKEHFTSKMETALQKVKTLEDDMVDIIKTVAKLDSDVNEKIESLELDLNHVKSSSSTIFESIDKRVAKIENKLADNNKSSFSKIVGPSQGNVLMPVDPRVIKDSLPEFHGRLEECPEKFLKCCESLLGRTNIPEEVYLQTVTQQLGGSAGSWWQNIKGLSLDWEGFKQEFLRRFNSDAVKASIQKKFLTETQPSGMRAGAFIIQKLQLFKRVKEGEEIDSCVTYIIELLHDKIRSLVKVAQPKTFDDLREIVTKLDEESSYHPPKSSPKVSSTDNPRKCYKCGRTGHMRDQCPEN